MISLRSIFQPNSLSSATCGLFNKEYEFLPQALAIRSTGGARGVMVIVVGNGHGDTSSNPGRDWLHFSPSSYE